jgi:hypothetical protein
MFFEHAGAGVVCDQRERADDPEVFDGGARREVTSARVESAPKTPPISVKAVAAEVPRGCPSALCTPA